MCICKQVDWRSHSYQSFSSGSRKWLVVKTCFKFKTQCREFEQRMKVQMTFERIMKALLKNKIIYSFELIYLQSWSGVSDHQLGYVFIEKTPKRSFRIFRVLFLYEPEFKRKWNVQIGISVPLTITCFIITSWTSKLCIFLLL